MNQRNNISHLPCEAWRRDGYVIVRGCIIVIIIIESSDRIKCYIENWINDVKRFVWIFEEKRTIHFTFITYIPQGRIVRINFRFQNFFNENQETPVSTCILINCNGTFNQLRELIIERQHFYYVFVAYKCFYRSLYTRA